jgi:hypothetical protein
MLRANVGLSRKVSRNYNSDGYSVNLDAEITAPLDDAEGVLERIQELFHLAEEALSQEIDRDQGEAAIGSHDEEPSAPDTRNTRPTDRSGNSPSHRPAPVGNNGNRQGQEEPATNKQVQFLLTMGKRFKLSTPQLETRVAEIIGRRCGIYDLTKKEAGLVLDHFTKSSSGNGRDAG